LKPEQKENWTKSRIFSSANEYESKESIYMKEEEFKPIVKEYLKSLGFDVLEIEIKQGILTPDFEVIGENDKYTIELKEKGDDPEEISRDEETLLRGEFLPKNISIGLRNTLEGIINEGVQQIKQYDPKGESFRIIWLHSAGIDPYLHDMRFHSTLFGIGHLLSIDRTPSGITCYYFNESAFFSWRNYLEGAILSYDVARSTGSWTFKVRLCINSLSPRVEQFRKSEIVSSMPKGLCDPQKEESWDHNVMIADCEIDRKRSNEVINYLQEKYGLDHLRAIPLKQSTITKLVDHGDIH
jgi:hypothetical protein